MLNILIADDHAMMREGLKRIIDDADGMTSVGQAADGLEALSMIGQLECDLLLMDMSMPGMTGVSLIERVRQQSPKLPILVMSMHNCGKIAASALAVGANGYITKDTDPELLPSLIKKIASGGRYVDAAIANQIIFDSTDKKLPHESLTKRESQIFRLIVSGRPTNRIADELFLSPKTVSTHKKRIMEKIGVDNSADLVRYSLEHQLSPPSLYPVG